MFEDPYWRKFNPLEYYWHILAFFVNTTYLIFGIILNVLVLVFYFK
jgi:hypothetical protein